MKITNTMRIARSITLGSACLLLISSSLVYSASAADDPAAIAVGKPAYIRVKNFSPPSGRPSLEDSMGGKGYVVRNLNPQNIAAAFTEEDTDEPTFHFGESVVPLEQKEGPPTLWLVKKGESKVWLPGYLLTAEKKQIEFLKSENRIPETLSYVYEDGARKTWGALIGGMGRSFILYSQGLILSVYPQGTSPFAIEGNAVIFSEQSASANWSQPPVFNAKGTAFQIKPTHLYYCTSQGESPAFQCLDLRELKVCQ